MSKFNKTIDWLIEQYVINDRPRAQIAEECGLTVAGLKSLLAKHNIKKEKIVINKDQLELLVNQGLNHKELEDKLGIGQTTLYRYLKKYNLKILAEPKYYSSYDGSNDELICSLYLDGFSSTEIGLVFNIAHNTVLNHLKKNGVPIRNLSESQWSFNNKEFPEELKSYDTIYDLYINKKLSKKDLGIKFNCDPCVIDRILTEFNIPIRGCSEAQIGLNSGSKHWNWKGGITPLAKRCREYFSTNQTFKVLQRDNFTCQLCGKKHKDLHVHHIIPFKSLLKDILDDNSNLDPVENIEELYNIIITDSRFTNLDNLITYCKDCHFYHIHSYQKADDKSCELLGSLTEKVEDNQQPSLENEKGSTTIPKGSTPKQVEAQDSLYSDDDMV